MTNVEFDRLAADLDRALLINVAYRLLGSMADAEDVAQETYFRWYRMTGVERDAIRTPAAWCVRVATRICLDNLTSARRRRELYVGPWLPEPIPSQNFQTTSVSTDPAELVAIGEHVTMAMLVVLESMTPAERISFVLRDMFSYPFSEISDILGRSEAACRQLAVSARRRVDPTRRCARDQQRHNDTTIALSKAFQRGDIESLIGLLDPDVSVTNDGGGRVRAALRPIFGTERVLRYLSGVRRKEPDVDTSVVDVNGQAGLRMQRGGVTIAVAALEVRDGLITRLWIMRNSDKLGYWNADSASTPRCRPVPAAHQSPQSRAPAT
ncbi:RNA polymerase subunit sigma-24 [Mycolicibacterium sp. GF69]|uniref:RNA polymerase sigma factor SigJ n=1 Tax=Mycolicibacterium sp. GF69 TaxID=2267251 RepID=UPI000DCBC014|nr:RNA polymerase sigma factor SigJ [Mycolicibacterium sp. GF69]RAV06028.1 RNA polymerase subunit sigma-24 [Mycolicibacterium sp. GF69]